jgi:hypothetical protein
MGKRGLGWVLRVAVGVEGKLHSKSNSHSMTIHGNEKETIPSSR